MRWSEFLRKGVEKDDKKALIDSYPIVGNCKELLAPKLNMEIATCLNESLNRQDMYLSRIQDEIGVAISALGKPLGNCFPNPSEQSNEFLKPSIDAAKILTNVHHSISTHRRHVILPHLNSSVRKIIEDYPIDEFLFGDKFAEKLKSSKEIQKTSSDLRLQNPSTSSKNYQRPKYKSKYKNQWNYKAKGRNTQGVSYNQARLKKKRTQY